MSRPPSLTPRRDGDASSGGAPPGPRRAAEPGDAEGRGTDGSPAAPGIPRPLARARTIARVMDDSIPVPFTKWRIGLDPLLGFLPGMGDWMGWAVSFNLMVAAAQLGVSAPVLLRMLGNLTIDAVVGVVPVFGDLFDAGWKANVRNLKLLEQHVADPAAATRGSRLRVGAVIGGTVLTLAGAAWGLYTVVREIVLWIFA